jgi:hypothetical protein
MIGFSHDNCAEGGCVATSDPRYCCRIERNTDGTLYGADTNVAERSIQGRTTTNTA